MFESYGKIKINQDQKPGCRSQKPGWYSLEVDDEIGEYYKWFYGRAGKTWYRCLNGCHITFIAGEKDDRIISESELDFCINSNIKFYYENIIWTNGRAFWLPVISGDLDKIRVQLGLNPRFLYHITLGNIKNQK